MKTAAVVLATLLAAPWSPAAAAPVRQAPSVASGSILHDLWRLWAGFWNPAAAADNGCHLDPDGGGCATLTVDNGCHLDPSGLCRSGG